MYKYIYFILFVFLFGGGYCLIIPSETQCLSNLINKSLYSGIYKLRNDTQFSYYCEDYPTIFKCNQTSNTLEYIKLKNILISSFILTSSYLECFQNEYLTLELENYRLDQLFYYSTLYNNFKVILLACNVPPITQPITHLHTLNITANGIYGMTGNIALSYVSNLVVLAIKDSTSAKISLKYSNDLTPSSNSKLTIMDIDSWNFINCNYLISLKSLSIKLSNDGKFDYESFKEMTSCNNGILDSLKLTGDSRPLNIPISYLSKMNQLKQLKFDNLNFNDPTDGSIDFSNMTSLETLAFNSPGKFTTDDIYALPSTISLKEFSITSQAKKSGYRLPGLFKSDSSTMESITIKNSQMNDNLDIMLPIPANLKYLDMSDNLMTGNVSERFCSVQSLVLKNNYITGVLPTCFTCHYKGNTKMIDSFSGVLMIVKKDVLCKSFTTFPSLKFDTTLNRTVLYGSELGFDPTYFTSIPSVNWIVEKPSFQFYTQGMDIGVFEFNWIYPGLKYTLSANSDQSPVISSVYVSKTGDLIIKGMGFKYNTTETVLSIKDVSYCSIKTTNYTTITCKLFVFTEQVQSLVDAQTVLQIKGLPDTEFPVTYLPDFTNYYYSCDVDCTGKGHCDRNSGTCICNCHGQGSCNIRTRSCECFTFWLGDECIIPDHYVSVVLPSNILGGNSTLIGWYGPVHDNPTVTIGTQDCFIHSITNDKIICEVGPGSGQHSIVVTQNSHSWIGKGLYLYNNTLMTCPNDCTNSTLGRCDQRTGICICFLKNWVGPDCGTEIFETVTKSNTTVDTETGTTNIDNDKTKYSISITKLQEIDIYDSVKVEYNLQNSKWSVTIDNTTSIHKSYIFKQDLNGQGNVITYKIQEVNMDSNFTFAGVDFLVLKDSIKLSVQISNYTYLNGLNTLRLLMESSVDGNTNNNENNHTHTCEEDVAEISNIDQQSLLNYVSITKNGKTLYGRFINRAISDGIPTYISSGILNKNETSITVAIRLPHCEYCLVDPDFSVLVSKPSFQLTCVSNSSDEDKKQWFLPVVIVVPIVGATCIIISSLMLYTKHRRALKLKLQSFLDPSIKMKNLS